MEKYGFLDFNIDPCSRTLIHEGRSGMKIEVSLFNALVPEVYQKKALGILNRFMEKHSNDIGIKDIDSVSGSLEAYIDDTIDTAKKYFLCMDVFVMEGGDMECHMMECPVLLEDDSFPEFKKCIMGELERMVFG